MGNKELFYASLFGNKLAGKIPALQLVESQTSERILPPIPFLPLQNEINIELKQNDFVAESWKATPPNIEDQFFPLTFRRRKSLRPGEPAEQWYTLPYEPLVSVSGSNILIKKAPAKAKNFIGTVKERWSQDDYEITITGSLIGPNMLGTVENCYPRSEFEKLRDYCISEQGIEVRCEILQLLGINYIVVEDFTFPFTKGENVQAYEMKCYSDFSSELLLEID